MTKRRGESRTSLLLLLQCRADALPLEVQPKVIEGLRSRAIAERLHASDTPCYILSSAADALMGSVGLHEMGIEGVFLKPVDPAIVIQTLKTRVGAGPRDAGHA